MPQATVHFLPHWGVCFSNTISPNLKFRDLPLSEYFSILLIFLRASFASSSNCYIALANYRLLGNFGNQIVLLSLEASEAAQPLLLERDLSLMMMIFVDCSKTKQYPALLSNSSDLLSHSDSGTPLVMHSPSIFSHLFLNIIYNRKLIMNPPC